MKVMVLVKATERSEAGELGSPEEFAEMDRFVGQLVEAGVMLAGDGLQPSSKGKRITFDADGGTTVLDGPFAETKEVVAGFSILEVASMDEAVEWVRRCPDPMPGEESEIEIRPVFEAEDFGKEFTPELRAQEERLREKISQKS